MIILPTIERELRAQARQPVTHVLRLLGAVALMVETFFFAVSHQFDQADGNKVFCLLNGTMFLFIWLIAPLVSADCVSRERREGTIGLLFLTPLKARDIIMAKGITHGLRALTMWFAALPVLTIPFLVGGVGWREAVWSVMVNFSAICLALAAGLLASSLSKRWLRAQILAVILAGTFAGVFVLAFGYGSWLTMAFFSNRTNLSPNVDEAGLWGFGVMTGLFGVDWGKMFIEMKRSGIGDHWLIGGAAMMALSVAFLRMVIGIAAWQLERVWHEEPPSARQQKVWKVLSTPVLGEAFLRGWLRRKLEVNPVGWLETRSWSGRTVTWGWLAAMVTFYCYGLGGYPSLVYFRRMQNLMELVLLAGMAATAAASFQRERETGVMELLLVSPMDEWQIISGRARALWGQFLPAVALLLVVWLYLKSVPLINGYYQQDGMDFMPFLIASYLAMPLVGLYNSLRCRNFVSSFLLTFFTVVVLPLGLLPVLGRVPGWLTPARPLSGFNGYFYEGMHDPVSQHPWLNLLNLLASPVFIALIQLVIGAVIGHRLYRDLKHRNFAFSRAMS